MVTMRTILIPIGFAAALVLANLLLNFSLQNLSSYSDHRYVRDARRESALRTAAESNVEAVEPAAKAVEEVEQLPASDETNNDENIDDVPDSLVVSDGANEKEEDEERDVVVVDDNSSTSPSATMDITENVTEISTPGEESATVPPDEEVTLPTSVEANDAATSPPVSLVDDDDDEDANDTTVAIGNSTNANVSSISVLTRQQRRKNKRNNNRNNRKAQRQQRASEEEEEESPMPVVPPTDVIIPSPSPTDVIIPSPPPTRRARDVLFIKTPKVGGTTLTVIIQRYAAHFNLSVGVPHPSLSQETCSSPEAERSWERAAGVAPGVNRERFNVFSSQVCLRSFMLKNVYWKQRERPLLLGLVREPWSRWVSAWRYLEKRCLEKDESMPDDVRKLCVTRLRRGFEQFTSDECVEKSKCSFQHAWMFAKWGLGGVVGSPRRLPNYDMLLVIEHLDLSLLVLHYDHGFPLETLPYLVANQNPDSVARIPPFTSELKQDALSRGLARDVAMYSKAMVRLRARVYSLNHSTSLPPGEFSRKLALLQRVNARAKEECNEDDAYRPDDCLVTHVMIQKKVGCRHACVDRVYREVYAESGESFT